MDSPAVDGGRVPSPPGEARGSISAVVRYSRVRTEEFTVVGVARSVAAFSMKTPSDSTTSEWSLSSSVSTAKRDSPPTRRYVIAQAPQPRAMRRHAVKRITPRPERPQRSRIDTERHRLAAAQPAADVCPVIDRARSQRLGTARGKGAPDCPLYRPAALGRRARPFAQIRVVCPFHW